MKNYEQLRAINAYNASKETTYNGVNNGKVVKKVPALIIENGFLGAMAFAIEKGDKTDGYLGVFKALLVHFKSLQDTVVKQVPAGDVAQWFKALGGGTATQLRLTTSEALAYLNYLRRFAKEDESDKATSDKASPTA